jgi:hypothetical protein
MRGRAGRRDARLHRKTRNQARTSSTQNEADLARGLGRVARPEALRATYPTADVAWPWQFAVPAVRVCRDPR